MFNIRQECHFALKTLNFQFNSKEKETGIQLPITTLYLTVHSQSITIDKTFQIVHQSQNNEK